MSDKIYIPGMGSPVEKLPEWAQTVYTIGIASLVWIFIIGLVGFIIWLFYDELGPTLFFSLVGLILFVVLVLIWPFIFL